MGRSPESSEGEEPAATKGNPIPVCPSVQAKPKTVDKPVRIVQKTPDNPVWFRIKDPKETTKPNPTEWEPLPYYHTYHKDERSYQYLARLDNITELRTPESIHFWTPECSAEELRYTGAWNADYLVDLRGGFYRIAVRVRDGDGSKLPSLADVDPASDWKDQVRQVRSIFQRWDRERNSCRRRLSLRLM